MSRIERSVEISTDRASVWATISNLQSIPTWNPNVKAATCGAVTSGLGATRACELSVGGRIDEVVSAWADAHHLWFAIGSHGAVRSADMGLILTSTGASTTVTAIADYHVAFGPMGAVIDHLAMKRLMTRMLDTSLAGLKRHLETPSPG